MYHTMNNYKSFSINVTEHPLPHSYRVAIPDCSKKTEASAFLLEVLPEEMRKRQRWAFWKYVKRGKDDKPTKVPFYAMGTQAQPNKAQNWLPFHVVLNKITQTSTEMTGLSFLLGPMVMIDIDDASLMNPKVREIVERAQTYTEVSPSGNGLKLIGSMDAFPFIGQNGSAEWFRKYGFRIELANWHKYTTVTGNVLIDPSGKVMNKINDITPLVDEILAESGETRLKRSVRWIRQYSGKNEAQAKELFEKVFGRPFDEAERECFPRSKSAAKPLPSDAPEDDLKIIDTIRTSRQGSKFTMLWGGQFHGPEDDASKGDLALASIVAFYTGPDPYRIKQIIKLSGRVRDKWERVDYLDNTIEKACDQQEFYQWQKWEKPEDPVASPGFQPVYDDENDSIEAGTEENPSTPKVWLVDGKIEQPILEEQVSSCRAARRMLQSATTPGRFKYQALPCGSKSCPVCRPVFEYNRYWWFAPILRQCSKLHHTVLREGDVKCDTIRKQFHRHGHETAEGEGVYISIITEDSLSGERYVNYISNMPIVLKNKDITIESYSISDMELPNLMESLLEDMVARTRIDSSRNISYSIFQRTKKKLENHLPQWKLAPKEYQIPRVSFSRLRHELSQRGYDYKEGNDTENNFSFLNFCIPGDEEDHKRFFGEVNNYNHSQQALHVH